MDKKPTIAFRADASSEIGLGHIMRCNTIASSIDKHAKILFISKNSTRKYIDKKYAVVKLPNNQTEELNLIRNVIKKYKINKLIIDLKQKVTAQYIKAINPRCHTILLDNVGSGAEYAHTLIYPVAHGDPVFFRSLKRKVHQGWQHIIVNNNFFAKSRRTNANTKKCRILLTMGGSDVFNYTPKIINVLKNQRFDFKCTVIIGPGFRSKNLGINDKRFRFVRDVRDLSEFMLTHDLGIFMFGTSIYEAAAARLPSIVIYDKKHKKDASRFAGFKTCRIIRGFDEKKFVKTIYDLIDNKTLIQSMVKNCVRYAKKTDAIKRLILS